MRAPTLLSFMATLPNTSANLVAGINFYTPTIFRSIGFDGTKVVLLASGSSASLFPKLLCGSFWMFEEVVELLTTMPGMYAAVKAVATILSLVFFIDRAGRRKLLLTSSIGASLALWYIGGFVTAAHIDLTKTQQKTIAGWIAIVCVYVFAVRSICQSCSQLSFQWVLIGEPRHSSRSPGMV